MATAFDSKKFYHFMTLSPVVHLIAFYTFVLRAYFALGRWSEIYRPDPKDLGFTLHHPFAWYSIALPVAVFPPWVVITIVGWKKKSFSKSFLLVNSAIFVASFVIMDRLAVIDPGGFHAWFAD